MELRRKIALLTILALIQIPCAGHAAEEDRDLALIAAEQEKSAEGEKIDEINPALTESISTDPTQETDKDKKERRKKLKQTRKEKEKINERKLEESSKRNDTRRDDTKRKNEPTIIINPDEPLISTPPPKPEPPAPTPPPKIETPSTVQIAPAIEQPSNPKPSVSTVETVVMPDQKVIYANFTEVARAVKFIPLYMPRKSGYEITAIYAQPGIVEIRYGRRWEPNVSLIVRTHKRADGEELQDISGVTGVKWRVDTTTGTTIYIAAWAVGHYTFSAQAENLSFAGFHSLVADELVELSTHYYLDL